jgi:rare lipoprotein A
MGTQRISSIVSRRQIVKLALGASAAIALGGASLVQQADARSGGGYRTTTAVNLRAQANTTSTVLAVLPKGTVVSTTGSSKNGFAPVTWNGKSGWVYEALLEWFTDSAPAPEIIGTATTTTGVNMRAGSSTGYGVIRVLPKGTQVSFTQVVKNGYRQIVHNGTEGWVLDEYLTNSSSDSPGVFVTTTAVNLRAQASTSSSVLKVVPKGAQVLDYDFVMSNGFRGVDYNGTVGWIHDSLLTRK